MRPGQDFQVHLADMTVNLLSSDAALEDLGMLNRFSWSVDEVYLN